MQDKTMVNDTLTGINGELVRFGEMIPQTENKELKQTLKQFRNACEQSQEELYQLARERSFCSRRKSRRGRCKTCTQSLLWVRNEVKTAKKAHSNESVPLKFSQIISR